MEAGQVLSELVLLEQESSLVLTSWGLELQVPVL
jgi:hypothetical protein